MDEYDIVRKLGTGMYTHMYQAVDRRTGQVVALKAVVCGQEMDEAMRRRLMRQVKTLRKLRHPNIVQMLGYGGAADSRQGLSHDVGLDGRLALVADVLPLAAAASSEIATWWRDAIGGGF